MSTSDEWFVAMRRYITRGSMDQIGKVETPAAREAPPSLPTVKAMTRRSSIE